MVTEIARRKWYGKEGVKSSPYVRSIPTVKKILSVFFVCMILVIFESIHPLATFHCIVTPVKALQFRNGDFVTQFYLYWNCYCGVRPQN